MAISSSSIFKLEPCVVCGKEVKISNWPGNQLYFIKHSCVAVEYSGQAVPDGKVDEIVNHWNAIMIAARNRILEAAKVKDE